jgi:phosphatidylserine decarboxylase
MFNYFLSNIVFYLARKRVWGITVIIKLFIFFYKVDMSIAENQEIKYYTTFNEFFTRAIKKTTRPIDNDKNSIISPVDGTISQFGKIKNGTIIQAKKHNYSLNALLANDSWIENFNNGYFITIYLSPKDYHRIHMTTDAKIDKITHIPGKLFSVSNNTTEKVANLFTRNQRTICFFKKNNFKFAKVLVAAVNVSAVETKWSGLINKKSSPQKWLFKNEEQCKKGDEIARFNMGSTVILLLPENIELASNIKITQKIKLGCKIGQIKY